MPQQAHFCLWTISLAFPPGGQCPPPHHVHTPWPHVAPCLLFSSLFCPALFPFFITSFLLDLSFSWHLLLWDPAGSTLYTKQCNFIRAVFRITPEDQWMRGRDQEDATLVMRQGAPTPPQWKFLERSNCALHRFWWFMILQHEQTETGQRPVLRVAAKTFSSVFVDVSLQRLGQILEARCCCSQGHFFCVRNICHWTW